MNSAQIIAKIKTGQSWPVYLLYGEETYLSRQLEIQITEQLLPADERETNVIAFDSDPEPAALINIIDSAPFFGSKNVIVIRGTTLFKAKKDGEGPKMGNDDLLQIFSNMPPYSHVILISDSKVDKRKKLFKIVDKYGVVIECSPMKVRDVREWLHKQLADAGRKMDNQAMEHLLAILSLMPQISLGFMQNELDKIFLYTNATKSITKQDLQEILSSLPEVSVFAMIDAVCQKQTAKALVLLQEQLASGQHPLQIIALLARQVRMLCQAKEYSQVMSSQEVAKQLGVPPFVGDKLIRQSTNFSFAVLKNTLVSLAEANCNFKLGSGIILENIVINFCS